MSEWKEGERKGGKRKNERTLRQTRMRESGGNERM
jgi:hypothetical protein